MPNQTINMNNVNSVSFNNNTVNEVRLNNSKIWPIRPAGEPYLTFSSPNSFTLSVNNSTKTWNGTLEYSTDKNTWTTWSGTSAISSSNDGKLYIRGIGNTIITGSSATSSTCPWRLRGSNISISGNIENLLDYATVELGNHPTMGNGAFNVLFAYPSSNTNGNIVDISQIVLPATTLTHRCYRGMFQGCTSITTAPKLPATTLASECYSYMFFYCTSLTTIPQLPATTLTNSCYLAMFYNCTALYVSSTQTTQAQYEWRIPTNSVISGTITYSQNNMFQYCPGTRSSDNLGGQPGQQYIYYTQNEPV